MKRSIWSWLESASYTALMWAKTKEQKRIESLQVNPVQDAHKNKTWQEELQEGAEYVTNVMRHVNTPDYGLLNNPDEANDKQAYFDWLNRMYSKAVKSNEVQEYSTKYRNFYESFKTETLTALNQHFLDSLYFEPNPIHRLIWSSTVQTPEEFSYSQIQICQREINLTKYDLSAWDWSDPSLKRAIVALIIRQCPTVIENDTIPELCKKYNVTKEDIRLFSLTQKVSVQQSYTLAQYLAGKDAIWYGITMGENAFVSIFEKDPLFTVAKAWRGIALTEEERKLNPIAFALYNERHAPTLRELSDPLPSTWALANELSGNDPITFCRFIEQSYNSQNKTLQLDLDFNNSNPILIANKPVDSDFLSNIDQHTGLQ